MQWYKHRSGRPFRAFGLVAALALASTIAAGAGLIGADFNGILYDVNQSTGVVSNPRATGLTGLSGIAYALNGTLYGIVQTGATAGSLYTINPATGAAALVGTLAGLSDFVEGDFAFDPTGGSLYGVNDFSGGNCWLFSINPSTGTAAHIGVVTPSCSGHSDLSAMAFGPGDQLWVVDLLNSKLLLVNKASGAVLNTINLTATGLGQTGGLAFDPGSGTAYLATGFMGTSSLYTLNTNTGTLTLVGALAGTTEGLSGLAFPPILPPTLSIFKSHASDFSQGQTNAQYSVTVSNSGSPSSGPVTVTETVPTGLTLVSMSGTGWSCSSNMCSRSDVLGPGLSYPSITVSVNVAANAPFQVTNQVTVSGGGSSSAAASDVTNVNPPICSSYNFTNSPATAGSGASTGTASFTTSGTNCPYTNVVSNNPDFITITSGSSGSGSNSIGYSVAANNSGGARQGSFTVLLANGLSVATFVINQAAASCSSLTLSPTQFTFGQGGGSGTVNFNTSPCSWTVTGAPSWITLPASSGSSSSFNFTVQPNPGNTRQATLSINNGQLTVAITESGLVCTFGITDSTLQFGVTGNFTSSGGSGGINVSAPPGCSWQATPSQSFITIEGSGSGNGSGGVGYSVSANSSPTNTQTGTITIAPGLLYLITEQPSGAPSYSCSANTTTIPIRPEGFAERVADVVLTCSGQQSPAGGVLGDIRISFNANITNLPIGGGKTDVLLLEDEPTPASLAIGVNAFRGVLSSVQGASVILFPSVQLASAAGGAFNHTWRITNARVNAQSLGAGSNVQASVSITAPAPFAVNGQLKVATLSSASAFALGPSSTVPGETVQPVSFTEGFATAFEPKAAPGEDPSQAGTVYNSESGFVNTAVLGAKTGFATSGTRLIVSIAHVPSGVTAYAPLGTITGTHAVLVSADSTGAGGFPVLGNAQFNGVNYRQITLTGGAGTATWEVTTSDPTKIEALPFNLLLINPNNVNVTGVTYAGALAPVSAGSAAQLPNATLPVPRFASGTVIVAQPSTVSLSVSPQPTATQSQGAALKPALRSAATPSNSAVGGTVTWTQVQANTGAPSSPTAPNVSVGGTLPPTWVITSCTAMDSSGVCPTLDPNNPSGSYTVNYPSLAPGQTGTIALTAESTSQTSGSVEFTSSINSDLGNSDPADQSFTINVPVFQIGLNVTLTNATSFSQGQMGAQYSVTIANGGLLPTSLPVTVTEILPPGLTLVSMSGDHWDCPSGTSSCTRSDPLGANSSYPAITVTVNVSSSAGSTVTNQVTAVTGVLEATGSDPTHINTVVVPTVTNVTSSTANGTYSVGATIPIQVTFSGSVTVTGTPQLALNSGGTANYSSGSGSSTLTFTYIVGSNDNSPDLDYTSTTALTLNGGTLNATLTLPAPGATGSLGANKSIVIKQPTGGGPTVTKVTSSTPNGTYGKPTLISIQISFSGPVTVTGTPQLALNSGGTASYVSGSGSATLTFVYAIGATDINPHLDYTSTTALTLNGGTIKDGSGNNATLTLPAPGAAGSLGANASFYIGTTTGTPPASFFNGQVTLGPSVNFLQFPGGNLFSYYNLTNFPIFYHYDMGFEAFIDGGNGQAYMYDFTTGHWWYTSASLFPYLYDFTLNTFIYYFPDSKNPPHYTMNPRTFANLTTGKIFTQ